MSYERESRSSSTAAGPTGKKEEGIEDMRPDLREAGLERYGRHGLEREIFFRGVYLVEQTIWLTLKKQRAQRGEPAHSRAGDRHAGAHKGNKATAPAPAAPAHGAAAAASASEP